MVRRAGYDIGSATTKVKVAEIDRCEGRILKVLFADNAPVFYRDDVNSSVPAFSEATMKKGLGVLRAFAAEAAKHDPEESSAVATSAFRRADNGHEMVVRIERELGLAVKIITQAQEARIGFVGAVMRSGADPKRAVVWDVGGRSMQISTLRPDGKMSIYQGRLASGQMRDYVIREVKQQPPTVETPNPLSPQEVVAARAYAESYAVEQVPADLRAKIAADDAVVVGIGALKYYGDKPAQTRGAVCTRSGLQHQIDELVGKSDDEIGGAYASTAVSDRVLIAGFMNALSIENVQLVDTDLSDGLLFESEYWVNDSAQGLIFLRERWGTRVESSPSLALGPSKVPHMVLHKWLGPRSFRSPTALP